LFGRDRYLALFRGLVLRTEEDRRLHSVPQPLLVLEGAHGSGKSALLKALADWVERAAPHARVDFARFDHTVDTPQVLSSLAFQLSRHYPVYGALEFPRLTAGIAVLDLQLDAFDRRLARAAVVERLAQSRDLETVRTLLKDAAGTALHAVQSATGVPVADDAGWLADLAPEVVISTLRRGRRARRILLGAAQDWYGHRGRGQRFDPVDVLVELNQWHAQPHVEDNRRRTSRLLCEAFLSDLAESFATARRAGELSLNSLILLDNADSALALGFATDLAEVKRELDEAGRRAGPVPVTVVFASCGTLLSRQPEVVEADPRTGWTPPAAGQLALWLRLRLADFTEAEIDAALAARARREGNDTQLRLMITSLTGGHPGSVRVLLGAAARYPQLWREPAVLLDQPAEAPIDDPASSGGTVAQELVRGLLGRQPDPGEDHTDRLVAAAAIRRQHAVALGAGSRPLLRGGLARFEADIDPCCGRSPPGPRPQCCADCCYATLRCVIRRCCPKSAGCPIRRPRTRPGPRPLTDCAHTSAPPRASMRRRTSSTTAWH
jgi:hypothetical protein